MVSYFNSLSMFSPSTPHGHHLGHHGHGHSHVAGPLSYQSPRVNPVSPHSTAAAVAAAAAAQSSAAYFGHHSAGYSTSHHYSSHPQFAVAAAAQQYNHMTADLNSNMYAAAMSGGISQFQSSLPGSYGIEEEPVDNTTSSLVTNNVPISPGLSWNWHNGNASAAQPVNPAFSSCRPTYEMASWGSNDEHQHINSTIDQNSPNTPSSETQPQSPGYGASITDEISPSSRGGGRGRGNTPITFQSNARSSADFKPLLLSSMPDVVHQSINGLPHLQLHQNHLNSNNSTNLNNIIELGPSTVTLNHDNMGKISMNDIENVENINCHHDEHLEHNHLCHPTGTVSLSPSSLSPPSGGTLMSPGRPQPARSPFEWMKKPSYQSQPEKCGRTRTKDKYRIVYSDHQRLELEKEFHYSRYITIRRKAELANNVGLSERQVKIWFQNRRAKERRSLKKQDGDSVCKDSKFDLSCSPGSGGNSVPSSFVTMSAFSAADPLYAAAQHHHNMAAMIGSAGPAAFVPAGAYSVGLPQPTTTSVRHGMLGHNSAQFPPSTTTAAFDPLPTAAERAAIAVAAQLPFVTPIKYE